MKKFKALIGILMAFLIMAAPVSAFASGFNTKTLDGIVFILTIFEDDEGGMWAGSGTGFFVGEAGKGPQYIITNAHVLSGYLEDGNAELYIVYDKNDYEEGYLVDYDGNLDIAIIKIANPTDKRKPLSIRQITDKDQGAAVYAVGYPAIVENAINTVDYYGSKDATVTSGIISRILLESKTGVNQIQTDAALSGGNSGGPLVDKSGYVVGINTWIIRDAAGYNYAVRIDEAFRIMNKNGIPYIVVPDGLSMTFMLIIIGGAAVLIAVIAVVLFLILHNKKKAKPVQSAAAFGGAGAYQPQPQNNMQAQPMGMAYPKPIIRSAAQQHRGMSVAISGHPVTIGRDVSVCAIVFKEDTPGVSSKHCQVTFDPASGDFILVDLGSTYGTFLRDGKKVTPNVPYKLRTKDFFYLGSDQNTLVVDME